jgi:activator of HSP90 ATPase
VEGTLPRDAGSRPRLRVWREGYSLAADHTWLCQIRLAHYHSAIHSHGGGLAFSFTLTDTIPAMPQQIYDAWLDSRGHTEMTGSTAEAKATEGASFSAWGGYIKGKNLKLEPGRRIVQSWRTTRFAPDDPDSEIEVLLEPVDGGTKLTLQHRNVPDGHAGYQNGGWQEHYFEPMKRYFAV